MCRELGVGYIGPSPETHDDQGFLLKEFWGDDGLHGNVKYGEVMLQHVLTTIAATIPMELNP